MLQQMLILLYYTAPAGCQWLVMAPRMVRHVAALAAWWTVRHVAAGTSNPVVCTDCGPVMCASITAHSLCLLAWTRRPPNPPPLLPRQRGG